MLLLPSVKNIIPVALPPLSAYTRNNFHRFSLVFTIISSVVISGVKQKACSISSSSLQRPDGFPSILLQCAFLIISILEYSLFFIDSCKALFSHTQALNHIRQASFVSPFHTGHFPNLSIKAPHKAWRFFLSAD